MLPFKIHLHNGKYISALHKTENIAAQNGRYTLHKTGNIRCTKRKIYTAQNGKYTLHKRENMFSAQNGKYTLHKREYTLHKREYRLQKTENGTLFRASIE